MRDLKAGDQCEHLEKVGDVYSGYKMERCQTKYLERIDGKPQQLVLVTEGRKARFVCTKHAPQMKMERTVRKQKPKKDHMAEQVILL